MYMLVEFMDREDDETMAAVVPDNWMTGEICCRWSPSPNTCFPQNWIFKQEDPDIGSWQSYNVKIVYSHGKFSESVLVI